jgi:hypothetical protein
MREDERKKTLKIDCKTVTIMNVGGRALMASVGVRVACK